MYVISRDIEKVNGVRATGFLRHISLINSLCICPSIRVATGKPNAFGNPNMFGAAFMISTWIKIGVPDLTAARVQYFNEEMRLAQVLTSQTHLVNQTCLVLPPCFPYELR